MLVGYIRVSKNDQNYDLQIDALKKKGCERIFQEKESGGKNDRTEYLAMLNILRKGDFVVIWRIDRLGRTTLELIKLMVEFREKGIEFISISEGIDTSTYMGRVWFMMSSVLAENERHVIIERTKAGLAAAKARGRTGGRAKGLTDAAKATALKAEILYKANQHTTDEICKTLKIGSKTTLQIFEVSRRGNQF